MNHERIVEYLRGRSDLSDWTFESSRERSRESFFTGERRDLSRSKEILRGSLTVHADGRMDDGEAGRGSAALSIPASVDRPELSALVDKALARARCSLAPAWKLPDGAAQVAAVPAADAFSDAGARLEALEEALFASYGAPECRDARDSGARLAAAELFLTARERRFTSSRGADRSWSDLVAEAEAAAVAHGGDGAEAELVHRWSSGAVEPAELGAEIRRLLRLAADRARAKPLPKTDLPVLLRGDAVPEFFAYFFNRTSAVQVRLGVADTLIGGPVVPGGCGGDAPALGIDPFLPGGTANRPVDADGYALCRTALAEAGIVQAFEGPVRYASWLGVAPVGACGTRWVSPGTLDESSLGDHLEALVFSDFFVDYASGEFGGELRLGVLFQDGKRIPVSGGSISGSIAAERNSFAFSASLVRNESFLGPASVRLSAARSTPASFR